MFEDWLIFYLMFGKISSFIFGFIFQVDTSFIEIVLLTVVSTSQF